MDDVVGIRFSSCHMGGNLEDLISLPLQAGSALLEAHIIRDAGLLRYLHRTFHDVEEVEEGAARCHVPRSTSV
jgi:hypothetical protein